MDTITLVWVYAFVDIAYGLASHTFTNATDATSLRAYSGCATGYWLLATGYTSTRTRPSIDNN